MVKQSMPQMLSYFYSFTEKPGIRLLQGEEGLKEIYQDTLRTKKDIFPTYPNRSTIPWR